MIKHFRFFVCFAFVFIIIFNFSYSGYRSSSKIERRSRPFLEYANSTQEQILEKSDYLIDGQDRFEWYREQAEKKNSSFKTAKTVNTLYAYEFEHEIVVTITSKLLGYEMYCHYFDENGHEISDPFESFVYPDYTVYCQKMDGAVKIGLSVDGVGYAQALPLVDRTRKEPQYQLSMCVATIYGTEPKWLQLIEMIEHFKLQGVEHFYLHIHNASTYDLKVVNDYIRTGELEVHYLFEDDRKDNFWHVVNIADCLIWSRGHSKWTIFADLDERLLMTNYTGNIRDFMEKEVKNETIGSVQFRQQWVLKNELLPEKYANEKQIEKWMPTHRFHNSTAIGPPGHTAKCIIDSRKVYIMLVHNVVAYFPAHHYGQRKLTPEEGLVRHYRDQSLGDWGTRWLNSTLKFGPLRQTDYPKKYLGRLTENVKRRAKYVYGNKLD